MINYPDEAPWLHIVVMGDRDRRTACYVGTLLLASGVDFVARVDEIRHSYRFWVNEKDREAISALWRIAEMMDESKLVELKGAVKDVMRAILEARKKSG